MQVATRGEANFTDALVGSRANNTTTMKKCWLEQSPRGRYVRITVAEGARDAPTSIAQI
jgi:hypothetical protein